MLPHSPEEVLNALQTIKDICLYFEDCEPVCPLYMVGCKLREDIPPDLWRLNKNYVAWKAFEE